MAVAARAVLRQQAYCTDISHALSLQPLPPSDLLGDLAGVFEEPIPLAKVMELLGSTKAMHVLHLQIGLQREALDVKAHGPQLT